MCKFSHARDSLCASMPIGCDRFMTTRDGGLHVRQVYFMVHCNVCLDTGIVRGFYDRGMCNCDTSDCDFTKQEGITE